jgi:murein DD-endopeptidase MepM/ murein hydrolase activator NlpD
LPPAATGARPQQLVSAGTFSFQGAMTQGGLLLGTAPLGTRSLSLDGAPVEVGPRGRFLIGFGREAEATSIIEAVLADGRRVRETLHIAPRQWDIQSIPSLPKGTTPTPEFLARRKIELARIEAARAQRNLSDGWEQPFLWPVTGRISGVFGSQRIYAGEPGAPHSGVDIARPTGTLVAAPADGVVVLAAGAPFTLEGNLLMIDHGMGLNSAFLHLSRIDVHEGQRVVRGQPVGAIGMTGRATGPHLHWGMMWRGVRIDPQLLVGAMRSLPQ